MMYGREKSDLAIVAMKSPNKTGGPAAEAREQRAGAEENASQHCTRRAQNRESVSQVLERVREAARLRKKERFTALFHHITVDLLRLSFFALKRDAAPGADGVTWQDYEADLERKLGDLHARVHRGVYRPQPSRRRYIPKADGRQRPLAVAALEDKIVQREIDDVMKKIYEEEFIELSYGIRPERRREEKKTPPIGCTRLSILPQCGGFCVAGSEEGVRKALASLHVTYTERGERTRIISDRRATRHEQDRYYRENAP